MKQPRGMFTSQEVLMVFVILISMLAILGVMVNKANAETAITTLAATNVVDYTTLNDNWNNLKVTVDAIYGDTSTAPLGTNLYLFTNDVSGIDDLIGVGAGTSYITNFTYYGNGSGITNVSAVPPANNTTTTNFTQFVTFPAGIGDGAGFDVTINMTNGTLDISGIPFLDWFNFTLKDNGGAHVWKSDGTATSTTEIVNFQTLTNVTKKYYADVYCDQGYAITNVTTNSASPNIIYLPNNTITDGLTANGTGITVTVAGDYDVDFIGSFEVSAAADIIITVYTNGAPIVNGSSREELGNNSYGNMVKKEFVTLPANSAVDARVYFGGALTNKTITFNDFDMHIRKLNTNE